MTNKTIKGHISVLITLWIFFTLLIISALIHPDAETWTIVAVCALIILIGSASLVAKILEEKRRMLDGEE